MTINSPELRRKLNGISRQLDNRTTGKVFAALSRLDDLSDRTLHRVEQASIDMKRFTELDAPYRNRAAELNERLPPIYRELIRNADEAGELRRNPPRIWETEDA